MSTTTAVALEDRGCELGVVEGEAREDDHRSAQKHQRHQRHQGALVDLEAEQVDAGEDPDEGQGDADPDRPRHQSLGKAGEPGRGGDVADEWNHQIGDHPHRDAQAEPLREAGDESQVGVQDAAGVDVAAAGARHRRGQDGVGERRQQRRHDRGRVRGQHPGPDARDAALNHQWDDVDRRPHHRADTGRGQTEQAHLATQARPGGGGVVRLDSWHLISAGRRAERPRTRLRDRRTSAENTAWREPARRAPARRRATRSRGSGSRPWIFDSIRRSGVSRSMPRDLSLSM